MNILDTFSDLLMQEFSSISVGQLLTVLGLTFALSLYVILIYRLVYSGVLFSKRFALSLILLAMITSVVILAISSNVVLSLGMVGALSIVRFRTAVKDAMDTVFMFWAIVVGIISGAGFILISLIATLVIGVLILAVFYVGKRINAGSYLVVLRLSPEVKPKDLLKGIPPYKIKSRNTTDAMQELVLETKLTEGQIQLLQKLMVRDDVHEVNVVSYNSQTTL